MDNLTTKLAIPLLMAFSSLALASLTGCNAAAPGYDDDGVRGYEKAQELYDTYKKIEGVYQGHLTRQKGQFTWKYPIEIRFHAITNFDGKGPDGRRISKPNLIGRYRRLDAISSVDTAFFAAEYREHNGSFEMAEGETENHFAITGQITKDFEITDGELRTYAGLQGYITAKRVSKVVQAPSESEREEQRRRQAELYSQVIGYYEGYGRTPHGERFPLHVRIYLVEEPVFGDADISYKVKLKGRFHWPEYDNISLDKWVDVQYAPNTGEIVMGTNANGSSNIPGAGFFVASGYFENNKLNLTSIKDHRGPLGTFTAERQVEQGQE